MRMKKNKGCKMPESNPDKESLLKFGKGNAKLTKKIATFSLPAGRTCPFAGYCKAQTERKETKTVLQVMHKDELDKITFSCFAANMELVYPNYRKAVYYNFDKLTSLGNDVDSLTDLISKSLPKRLKLVRVHVGGDFYSQAYFDAWVNVAELNPQKIFYAYTKSIQFWVEHIKNVGPIPKNLILTASYGGMHDELISQNDLKNVKVYQSLEAAAADNREIDHDDSLALNADIKEFGLLLHGKQPKGSSAATAIKALKEAGVKFSYSSTKKK